MISKSKEWYVFYTKSRWEKKVMNLLERSNFEVFLPLHKVLRQWSDRKKKMEVPVFNSYIFVNARHNQIHDILQVPGVVKNLWYNGEPAVLNDRDYRNIKSLLETGLTMETQRLTHEFKSGDDVKVSEGVFRGIQGNVYKMDKNTCYVIIESMGQALTIHLPKDFFQEVS